MDARGEEVGSMGVLAADLVRRQPRPDEIFGKDSRCDPLRSARS
jgi:hypothetical protein